MINYYKEEICAKSQAWIGVEDGGHVRKPTRLNVAESGAPNTSSMPSTMELSSYVSSVTFAQISYCRCWKMFKRFEHSAKEDLFLGNIGTSLKAFLI